MNAALANQTAHAQSDLLKPLEAAAELRRSRDFVYDLIIEGKLEAHSQGSRTRQFLRITRRSVALYHLETSNRPPDDLFDQVKALAATLSPRRRRELANRLLR